MRSKRDRTTRRMDWLAFNLRWALLTAAAVMVLLRPGATPLGVLIALVMIAALYNIGLTLLEFLEYWRWWLPWATLTADSVLSLMLFTASGGSAGPLIWIGLLPALTAALRDTWPVALSVIAGFTLAQAVAMLVLDPLDFSPLLSLGLVALILWPVTFAGAYLASRLRAFIRVALRDDQQAEVKRTQILRQHARAVYDMASMASAMFDYDKVLEAAINIGASGAEQALGGDSPVVSAVLLFKEDQLQVTSGRGLPPVDFRVVCPGREGVLGNVIRTSDPEVILNPSKDPELEAFVAFRACRSLMALPLRAGYNTWGVVLYGHPQARFFDEDQRALLEAIVNQAIIALQNAQLYQNLRTEKERLVEVQEEATKKLARDLHDGPTQAIAALAMRANFVRRLLDRDVKAAGEELFKMEDLARRTTKEIRHMLFTLRPLVLESQGLTAALRQLAEKMKETHSQNVIVEAEPGVDDKLELNQQGVLFYIVEEAVGNARKHAQAEHIWVRLKTQRDILVVEIQDDGVGFNVGAMDANYDKRGSLGMVNMRERAEMISGAVKIDSAEGRGAKITVLVPLTEAARDRVRG
jgi:signal transduction histidine kinase